jgi:hypothetical protein
MLFSDQVREAVAILNGGLDLLLASVRPPTNRSAYELRTAVGIVRATPEDWLYDGTIGTKLKAAFEEAVKAGAVFDGMDALRKYLSELFPVSNLAQLIVDVMLVMTVSSMADIMRKFVFRSRDDVQKMIDRMTAALEPVKEAAADRLPAATYNAVNRLGSMVMFHLSQTELTLPRIVSFTYTTPLPSLVIAYRIYGDASRSDEIVAENRVIHPAFMPLKVRALSR